MTKIRKAKETMSAKERVLRTFAFEKTDRVPIDYATNGSIHHRLCVELGIPVASDNSCNDILFSETLKSFSLSGMVSFVCIVCSSFLKIQIDYHDIAMR